jgi:hypothetical protein
MRTLKSGLTTVIAIGLLAGSAVGVAAQDEDPLAPAYVEFTSGWPVDEPLLLEVEVAASDPRVSGLLTVASDNDGPNAELGAEGLDVKLTVYQVRLLNDGGSWTGTGQRIGGGPEIEDVPPRDVGMWTLVGAGDYEGLSLYVSSQASGDQDAEYDWIEQTWGVIIPTAWVPEGPEWPIR